MPTIFRVSFEIGLVDKMRLLNVQVIGSCTRVYKYLTVILRERATCLVGYLFNNYPAKSRGLSPDT